MALSLCPSVYVCFSISISISISISMSIQGEADEVEMLGATKADTETSCGGLDITQLSEASTATVNLLIPPP